MSQKENQCEFNPHHGLKKKNEISLEIVHENPGRMDVFIDQL